jgi:hypothetical protein
MTPGGDRRSAAAIAVVEQTFSGAEAAAAVAAPTATMAQGAAIPGAAAMAKKPAAVTEATAVQQAQQQASGFVNPACGILGVVTIRNRWGHILAAGGEIVGRNLVG